MSVFLRNIFSVIVAGGSGLRMGSIVAKQFLPLGEKPILTHTVEKFLKIPNNKVIAVLPSKDLSFWEEIVNSNELLSEAVKSHRLITVEGGPTRFQSVKNGLMSIPDLEGLVAIHDGVRPLVPTRLIIKSFEEADKHGSAVLSVASKDSVRILKPNRENQHLNRDVVKLIQTPQTFNLIKIKEAFAHGEKDFFTDDASVFEYAGHKINLIEGDYSNIKITTPEDLEIAELLLKYENNSSF